jgi:hypothetical protein
MSFFIILKEEYLWVKKIGQDLLVLVQGIKKKISNAKDLSLETVIVRDAVAKVSSAVKRYIDFYCELEIQK